MNGYVSKTVQDTRIVSIKVEQEVPCALSNSDIAEDLEWPLTAPNYPNFTFCTAFHIFVMAVVRNFKFGLSVNGSKSQMADDKSSLKGAWSWSRDTF